MLANQIVEKFKTVTDKQKVAMLEVMPRELLSIIGPIYPELGSNGQVWGAYLERIGWKGARTIPVKDQKYYLAPLLNPEVNELDKFLLKTFLASRILVAETWAAVKYLVANDYTCSIRDFGFELNRAGADALPLILEWLAGDNEHTVLGVLSDIQLKNWTSDKAVNQLCQVVMTTYFRQSSEYLKEDCLETLLSTKPDLALTLLSHMMENPLMSKQENKQLLYVGKIRDKVAELYQQATDQAIKHRFLKLSLQKGFGWQELDWPKALVELLMVNSNQFETDFFTYPQKTGEKIMAKLADVSGLSKKEQTQVLKTGKNILMRMLVEKIKLGDEAITFLRENSAAFTVDEYVQFITLVLEQDGQENFVSSQFEYPGCTPEQVQAYLPRLSGYAAFYAALCIIRRIAETDGTFAKHEAALAAAIPLVVDKLLQVSYAEQGPIELLMLVPSKYWEDGLTAILTKAEAHVKLSFALWILAYDPDHELAKAAIVSAMTDDGYASQKILKQYFGVKED
jgi:hypothetical protein